MEFVLYQIASHDKVQSRARKEIMEKIEKHGGRLTYEALMEMQYLDQILNGKLRNKGALFELILFSPFQSPCGFTHLSS